MVSDFFLDRHAPPALAKTTEGGAYPSAQLKYIEQPLKEGSTGSGYPPSTHPPRKLFLIATKKLFAHNKILIIEHYTIVR
ncbi:MAG: hypothetical protein ACK5O9_04795 [Holosporales bacterium]|jgi:hypothetical protein